MAYARMLNIRISELRSKEINENCHKNISIKELEDLFTEPQRTRMPIVLPKSEVSKTEKSVTLPRPNKPRQKIENKTIKESIITDVRNRF